MSSMDFYKLAGAAILVALVLAVIGAIGNKLADPRDRGAAVLASAAATPAPAKAVAPAEPTIPLATLLAAADPAKGAKAFKKCKACHTQTNGGKNKIGPNLWNIVNRARGATDGFGYSAAVKGKDGAWSYDSLNAFLAKPRAYIPGTKMAFAGIRKAKERAALIAFLRSLSDNPAPLP